MRTRCLICALQIALVDLLWAQSTTTLLQVMEAPAGTSGLLASKAVLGADLLVVSFPTSTGGSVRVHSRNEGGVNQWGVVQSMEANTAQSSFGKALALAHDELFIGSDQGTTSLRWNSSSGLFDVARAIDDFPVAMIATIDTLLAISTVPTSGGEGVLGAFDGITRIFARDTNVDTGWSLQDVVVIPPNPFVTGGWTCAGESMAIGRNVIAMGDPCIQSTPFSNSSHVYLVDRELDGFDNNIIASFSVDALGMRMGRSVVIKGDTLFLPVISTLDGGSFINVLQWVGADLLGQHFVHLDTLHLSAFEEGPLSFDLSICVDEEGSVRATTPQGVVFFRHQETIGSWSDGELLVGTDYTGNMVCAHELLAIGGYGQVRLYGTQSLGLNDPGPSAGRILLTPNPAWDRVTVHGIDNGSFVSRLVLIDAAGRTIRTVPWSDLRTLDLDLRGIPEQLLVLRAEDVFGRQIGTARLAIGLN